MKTRWIHLLIVLIISSCKNHFTTGERTNINTVANVIYKSNEPLKINPSSKNLEVFTFISQWDLVDENEHSYYISNQSFTKSNRLCSGEIDQDYARIGSCTVFFINPNTALTAGHCLQGTSNNCDNFFITQYESESDFEMNETRIEIPKNKTLKCDHVINLRLNNKINDLAILKFNKPRSRQRLNISNEIISNELYSLTHQMGLPKSELNGEILNDKAIDKKFKVSMNFFDGSSGSPVMDKYSDKIVGILVKGEKDFVLDTIDNCRKIKRCFNNECQGEDILVLNLIDELNKFL